MSDDLEKESLKYEETELHTTPDPLEEVSSEPLNITPINTSEHNVNCLRSMFQDFNKSELIHHIEEHYQDKDRVVSSLMENLYKIISDTELIKCQIPKPPSQAKSLTSKKQTQSRCDLECFNRSTMSKRSITSNRSKMLTYKPPSGKVVVPNKYSVMSPKVSINIGFNKKVQLADHENLNLKQVEISLEEKSKVKGKFERDLDSSLNSTKTSIKKLNSKRNNLSNPTFAETNNISDKKKPKYASSNCSLNAMTPQKINKDEECNMMRSSNSTYKFEPKKKQTIHSNLESPITHHTTCKNSQDIKITRNSSSQDELNKLTSSKLKSHKNLLDLQPLEAARTKYYGFKSSRVESMFTNPKYSRVQSTLLNFLSPTDSAKLRLLSSSMLFQYVEYNSTKIKFEIDQRKKSFELKNPFDDLSVSHELINKVMKSDLILSDFLVISANLKYLAPFANTLYQLVTIGDGDRMSNHKQMTLEEEIKFLESNSLNKNCYFFFSSIIDTIQNDRAHYETLKSRYNSRLLNLAFIELSPPSSSFRYYNDLLRQLKKILEADRMTECLLDCEILEDKIEKVRNYFRPKHL